MVYISFKKHTNFGWQRHSILMRHKKKRKALIRVLVCCLCYLDVLGGFKSIQLIEKFQHCSLHLTVTAWAALQTGGPDGVDLVHEDDWWSVFSSHHKKLTHHSSTWRGRKRKRSEGCCTLPLIGSQSDFFLKGQLTLSNKLLDQFRARHSDEGTVSVVGHSSG